MGTIESEEIDDMEREYRGIKNRLKKSEITGLKFRADTERLKDKIGVYEIIGSKLPDVKAGKRSWKEGAIIGFLFLPMWFLIGSVLMGAEARLGNEKVAGLIDLIFMLPLVPMASVNHRFGIATPLLFATILFWTIIGAFIGYFVSHNRSRQ